MSLSQKLSDLIKSALGSREAADELIGTINNLEIEAGIQALTGDVSASGVGSVSATVNSVGGSSSSKIHTAEILVNNLGLNQTLYVNVNSGNDITGTGTINNPFQTINAAQNSFSDQSATKPYLLVLAEGNYSEIPTYVPKTYVSLAGYNANNATVKRSDNSTIPITFGGTTNFTQTFSNIGFGGAVTITRIAGQALSAGTFQFLNCSSGSNLTMTGSGNNSNFDRLQILGGVMSAVFANATITLFQGTNTLNATFSAVGTDATQTAGFVQSIFNSRSAFISISGTTAVQSRNSVNTRITITDTLGTFNGDIGSFPAGNSTAGIQLSGGATMAQLTKASLSSHLRNNTKTVLTTPYTLDPNVDYVVLTNLTVAGAVGLTLPAMTASAYAEGTSYVISDAKGDAGTNTITITAGGTDTFAGGGTTNTITTNFGSKTYFYSSGVWYLTAHN